MDDQTIDTDFDDSDKQGVMSSQGEGGDEPTETRGGGGGGCCSKSYSYVIGHLRENYMCVLDLNTVRAKDFVMGVWGCLVFAVQVWDYFENSRAAYWLSISMNAVMFVDLGLRLIDQRLSLVTGLTNFARAKLYKAEPVPWPPTANVARLFWFVFECGLSIGLKVTLPASDWRLMIPNAFFTFWLLVEAAVHWCPFYVIYTIFVKIGYLPVDPGMGDRDCFEGSFMGPTCQVDRLRVTKKTSDVQSISMKVQPASPKKKENELTRIEVLDSADQPPVKLTNQWTSGTSKEYEVEEVVAPLNSE